MITFPALLVGVILLIVLGIMGVRLQRALHRFRIKKTYTAALEAPSVSVCIPARNEKHAMTQCLERVLASDYEKLEIIVFDDNSADDTSVLIKSFAHAGVRFVSGTELPSGWLGKNHALEVLAREASGTYIVFMDVDTHINTTTISQLVGYIMTEKAEMLSVIPGRADVWRSSTLFGHLRYFWELILSRKNAPATASSLWMINRRTLLDTFGGFTRLSGSVSPEANLAAMLGAGAYRCLVTVGSLGVTYEKKWSSQAETARRLLYPMVGGKPTGGLVAASILLLLNVPAFAVISAALFGWSPVHTIFLVILAGFMVLYTYYCAHLWAKAWWFGGLLWPVVILQELALLLASILGYARQTITWKGRPVVVHPLPERK
jgi:chlorobactene glucosyltransferase